MTPEEAKQALEMSNTDSNHLGFWTYVLVPFTYGGEVIHFWPLENSRERHYGQRLENGGIAPMRTTERVSVCNLDTQAHGGWLTPTDDYYNRLRMPRCKRCVKRLIKLTQEVQL